jgi:alcohol dehydrogenase
MQVFDFHLPTRIVFGAGCLSELGSLAKELSTRRALVVSDPGVVAAGHAQLGLESLQAAGLETELFDQVAANPTTIDVEAGLAVALELRPDLLVGLGGGSSMDCAKGINFLYSCGGTIQQYWGIGKATTDLLPMIAVPTTAGTGSEAQSFALISDPETHVKMACGDKRAACRVALLDPELTMTQPALVTALTGYDALAHAIETFVTTKRNMMSLSFSREAWRLLAANYRRVLSNPDDLDARGAMQLGACLAGLAIENSMLGAAHALANPLTSHYGVAHGQAIALMLPHVVRYNGPQVSATYRELLETAAGLPGMPSPDAGAEGLADFLSLLASESNLATRLRQCDVTEEMLPQLAEDATKQWTVRFNPRPAAKEDLLAMYQAAL